MTLEQCLERALCGAECPQSGDIVIVAVSGGIDSMVLIHAVCALQRAGKIACTLRAAHLNHGIRGVSADQDQHLVEKACRNLGIPLEVSRIQVEPGASLENRARRARRRFFKATAEKFQARSVLLAHNADDQAETVLHRILCGAGPDGLGGMRYAQPLEGGRILLLRPLLQVSRVMIEAHAEKLGIAFREDETNRDLEHRRNFLRHEVLPYLRKTYNPAVDRALVRLGGIMQETADLIGEQAREGLERVIRTPDPGLCGLLKHEAHAILCLDRKALGGLSPGLRSVVLRQAIRGRWPDDPPLPGRIALDDLIRRVVVPGGSPHPWQVRHGLHGLMDGEILLLARSRLTVNRSPVEGIPVEPGDDLEIRPLGFALRTALHVCAPGTAAALIRADDPRHQVLDADRTGTDLIVRSPLDGDTFSPRGRNHGIALNRFLKKRGMPAFQRHQTLVFASRNSGEIHSIWGRAVSGHARVTPVTVRVLEIWNQALDCSPGHEKNASP